MAIWAKMFETWCTDISELLLRHAPQSFVSSGCEFSRPPSHIDGSSSASLRSSCHICALLLVNHACCVQAVTTAHAEVGGGRVRHAALRAGARLQVGATLAAALRPFWVL